MQNVEHVIWKAITTKDHLPFPRLLKRDLNTQDPKATFQPGLQSIKIQIWHELLGHQWNHTGQIYSHSRNIVDINAFSVMVWQNLATLGMRLC